MIKTNKKFSNSQSGSILILVLVFAAVFMTIGAGLIGLVVTQDRLASQKLAYQEALHIAEAGLNYYRWHLAHAPDDFQDGTGGPGPYLHDYKDPEGNVVGKFALEIIAPSGCDQSVRVESTGWVLEYPNAKRKVKARYGKKSLAKYAFLTNSNVWFGESEGLKGEFHSNGGIRMDGTQNSICFSAKEKYICGPEHSCSESNCTEPCEWTADGCECPGIWGSGHGGPDGFWQFPVPAIDFDSITQDLAFIKSEAQSSGIYLGSSGQGYHIRFKNNGTFDIYQVQNRKQKVWGYNGEKWVHESNDIDEEFFLQNYPIPPDCAPIFVEDDVWVDGEVNGQVTLVAARLPDVSQNNARLIINGDITYENSNSVLGLIGQKDILIPLYSPDNLRIEAAMLAQKGHIIRYYYPSWYSPYHIRNTIQTYGSIITNTIWTFSWVDSGGTVISGYQNTDMNYDSSLTFNPPPYFPTSGDYQFISWEEVQ